MKAVKKWIRRWTCMGLAVVMALSVYTAPAAAEDHPFHRLKDSIIRIPKKQGFFPSFSAPSRQGFRPAPKGLPAGRGILRIPCESAAKAHGRPLPVCTRLRSGNRIPSGFPYSIIPRRAPPKSLTPSTIRSSAIVE